MQITGIEVIRGNPGVAGSAVIGVPAGEKLSVEVGDTVRVYMTVEHRGPRIENAEVYTAIGWQTGIIIQEFIEAYVGRTGKVLTFDESPDFGTYPIVCDVPIEPIMMPVEFALYGNALDIYAKIINVPGPDIFTDPFYYKVIEVEEAEYELIQHTISHFAYIYDGDAEVTTITLKTDPFKPADWVPEKFIAELEREARESGVLILETKVYVDTSPLFWTDYRIEVTGTPPPSTEGVGVGALPAIPLFVKIILAALAIAFGIWVITWAVERFLGVFKTKPGLEDMKPTWGKEALILDIQDTEGWLEREERLERPVTPAETLEGMSEEELRHLLNQLGEKVVPPGIEWIAVAVVGGLAVLGVGAALALAGRPKE